MSNFRAYAGSKRFLLVAAILTSALCANFFLLRSILSSNAAIAQPPTPAAAGTPAPTTIKVGKMMRLWTWLQATCPDAVRACEDDTAAAGCFDTMVSYVECDISFRAGARTVATRLDDCRPSCLKEDLSGAACDNSALRGLAECMERTQDTYWYEDPASNCSNGQPDATQSQCEANGAVWLPSSNPEGDLAKTQTYSTPSTTTTASFPPAIFLAVGAFFDMYPLHFLRGWERRAVFIDPLYHYRNIRHNLSFADESPHGLTNKAPLYTALPRDDVHDIAYQLARELNRTARCSKKPKDTALANYRFLGMAVDDSDLRQPRVELAWMGRGVRRSLLYIVGRTDEVDFGQVLGGQPVGTLSMVSAGKSVWLSAVKGALCPPGVKMKWSRFVNDPKKKIPTNGTTTGKEFRVLTTQRGAHRQQILLEFLPFLIGPCTPIRIQWLVDKFHEKRRPKTKDGIAALQRDAANELMRRGLVTTEEVRDCSCGYCVTCTTDRTHTHNNCMHRWIHDAIPDEYGDIVSCNTKCYGWLFVGPRSSNNTMPK